MGLGSDDQPCPPCLEEPASDNHACYFSISLNAALETVTSYFNFFHMSFLPSQGNHGVEWAGMISGLLMGHSSPDKTCY